MLLRPCEVCCAALELFSELLQLGAILFGRGACSMPAVAPESALLCVTHAVPVPSSVLF